MKTPGTARRALRLLAWGALGALAVLAVRAFVGDVFQVTSPSMEPELHGDPRDGDWVFVLFEDDPAPRRFELVVLTRPDAKAPLVKRVVGLPSETIRIANGDLYVDGRLLPPDAPRPPLVRLFDASRDAFRDGFAVDDAQRWVVNGGAWRVDARGGRNVVARLRRLDDDYELPSGARVEGEQQVNDAVVAFELAFEGAWKRFSVRLTEEADVFLAELVPGEREGLAYARLLRTTAAGLAAGDRPEVLAEAELRLAPGERCALRFANLDNELALELRPAAGAPLAVRASYSANTPMSPTEGNPTHFRPRLEIGGDDFVAELRNLRVWRDLFFSDLGEQHGVDRPEPLGPNELFVVGDNSNHSSDSRAWGPVPLERVVGRPVAVVWPPSRWRVLRTPGE